MEEKIMMIQMKNNNMPIFSFLILLFTGCKSETIQYQIANSYSGPCVVFISENVSQGTGHSIVITNGLARIGKTDMKKSFLFKSEDQKEIEIIPIGASDEKVTDSNRYIFGLTEGLTSSNCTSADVKMITFFVGTAKQYEEWMKNFNSSFLDYFDSKKIDWCAYYLQR